MSKKEKINYLMESLDTYIKTVLYSSINKEINTILDKCVFKVLGDLYLNSNRFEPSEYDIELVTKKEITVGISNIFKNQEYSSLERFLREKNMFDSYGEDNPKFIKLLNGVDPNSNNASSLCIDVSKSNSLFSLKNIDFRKTDGNGNTILNKLIDQFNDTSIKELMKKFNVMATYPNDQGVKPYNYAINKIKAQNSNYQLIKPIKISEYGKNESLFIKRLVEYSNIIRELLSSNSSFEDITFEGSVNFTVNTFINSVFLLSEYLWDVLYDSIGDDCENDIQSNGDDCENDIWGNDDIENLKKIFDPKFVEEKMVLIAHNKYGLDYGAMVEDSGKLIEGNTEKNEKDLIKIEAEIIKNQEKINKIENEIIKIGGEATSYSKNLIIKKLKDKKEKLEYILNELNELIKKKREEEKKEEEEEEKKEEEEEKENNESDKKKDFFGELGEFVKDEPYYYRIIEYINGKVLGNNEENEENEENYPCEFIFKLLNAQNIEKLNENEDLFKSLNKFYSCIYSRVYSNYMDLDKNLGVTYNRLSTRIIEILKMNIVNPIKYECYFALMFRCIEIYRDNDKEIEGIENEVLNFESPLSKKIIKMIGKILFNSVLNENSLNDKNIVDTVTSTELLVNEILSIGDINDETSKNILNDYFDFYRQMALQLSNLLYKMLNEIIEILRVNGLLLQIGYQINNQENEITKKIEGRKNAIM